jgi:hypothetical protein
MAQALVLTPWHTDEDGNRNLLLTVALITRNQTTFSQWWVQDATGQGAGRIPFGPNTCAALVECDVATLSFIDSDARFRVLYDDNSRLATRILNRNQFNAVRDYFITRLGWSAAQVDAAIGTEVGGRTVGQLTDALIAYLRNV